ncbi:MAG TPA: hypothetical protein VGI16_14420 [Candidatus Acidoferrum sp.]|jgi:hypothetical protein
MALTSLINFTERILNQNSGQTQNDFSSGQSNRTQRDGENGRVENPGDQFTPSARNSGAQDTAQAAGIFSVNHVAIFSAAADFLLVQPSNTNAAAPQTTTPVNSPSTPTAAFAAANAVPAVAANGATATSPATFSATSAATSTAPAATAGSAGIAAATVGATQAANVQSQLESLNVALAALGLNTQDIQAVDNIATLINNFSPNAFAALLQQFQTLAQQAGQGSTANSATPATSAAAINANAANAGGPIAAFGSAIANGAVANAAAGSAVSSAAATTAAAAVATGSAARGNANSGFKVTELEIRFSGAEVSGTTAAGGNGKGPGSGTNATASENFQISAFSLQVEEVNLTLSNNSGQTVQVHAQPSATQDSRSAVAPVDVAHRAVALNVAAQNAAQQSVALPIAATPSVAAQNVATPSSKFTQAATA